MDFDPSSATYDSRGRRHVGVHLLGHSFGTFVMAWIIRRRPDLVKFATFLDPVCFRLFSPDLAYNMVYREPKTWLQVGMQYFAAKELHISQCLTRQFNWGQFVLWPEKLKCPTLAVLSGCDSVLPAHSVRVYLSAADEIRSQSLAELRERQVPNEVKASLSPIGVQFYANMGHGEWMARPGARPVLEQIRDSIVGLEKKGVNLDI